MAYSSVIRLNKAFVFAALCVAMAMVETAEGQGVPFSMTAADVTQFEYMHGLSPLGVNLYYTPATNGSVKFGLNAPSGGWVSLGWSADCSMFAADVVIAGVSPPTALPGTYTTAAKPGRTLLPAAALAEDINLRSAWNATVAFLTVYRNVGGGNVPLTGTSICVIWAYSNSSAPTYHGPERRGAFKIDVTETVAEGSMAAEEGSKAAEEGSMPAEEGAKAAGEGSKPAEEEAMPAEGSKAAEEEAMPAEGSKAAEEESAAAEEGSKPAEEKPGAAEEGSKAAEESSPAEGGSKTAESAGEGKSGEEPAAGDKPTAEASASPVTAKGAKGDSEASGSKSAPEAVNGGSVESPPRTKTDQRSPASAPAQRGGGTKRAPNAAASITVALLVALLTFTAYLVV